MPIYEFRCRECDAIEESFQKVNDPVPQQCASCKKHNTLEKIVSHTSFQLKGGGWYSDLYSSTKKSDGNSAASSTSTPPKSDSSNKEAPAASQATPTTGSSTN